MIPDGFRQPFMANDRRGAIIQRGSKWQKNLFLFIRGS
jgi:hypothetical protein